MIIKQSSNFGMFPFLAFLAPLVVRAISEILIGPFIMGLDALGCYVQNILVRLRNGVGFRNFMAVYATVSPLFLLLFEEVYKSGRIAVHMYNSGVYHSTSDSEH